MEPRPSSSAFVVPAMTSAGAGVIHAVAAGIHADQPTLTRIFLTLAVAQVGVAIAGFVRPGRAAAIAVIAVNASAAAGWLITRMVGISWIPGLEIAERPELADTTAAVLALVAAVAAAATLFDRAPALPGRVAVNAAVLTAVLLVPGLADATTHDHGSHAHDEATEHPHDDGRSGAPEPAGGTTSADHEHPVGAPSVVEHEHPGGAPSVVEHEQTGDATATDHRHSGDDPAAWPRPWDPAAPFSFTGVPGVTAEQEARAEQLVDDTLRELPAFADVATLESLGYRSIGDASTGHEHYINTALIDDDRFLDPTAPEALVFQVDGDRRTLVSAMFIVGQTPIDDPDLVDFAGPLMQWHVHDNLCWGLDEQGEPVVKGVTDQFGGACPAGTVNTGGDNPMVHVWIAPHECGPFAALEGHGAGQAAAPGGARTDQCGHAEHATVSATVPYDPSRPIDLGGIDGVTLEQQAFAENLVAATVRDLPQWADLDAVEAAGFESIGDGFTGHEHYIQWNWIDDDVYLDPDQPESLVFEPQPDGTKRLVSAMYMLPTDFDLTTVPDWGGELMQWHVHGDLCFTDDPVAPQVAGVKPIGTSCTPPLVDGTGAPMIHVWITPHPCGPFAALDGVAGGQVPAGETVNCDAAHGSH